MQAMHLIPVVIHSTKNSEVQELTETVEFYCDDLPSPTTFDSEFSPGAQNGMTLTGSQ